MSKDSFAEQLANFDLSGPVEVNIIFEDEEEQASMVIKEENTDEEKIYTNNNLNTIINPIDSRHNEKIIKIANDFASSSTTQGNGRSAENCANDLKENLFHTKCDNAEVNKNSGEVDTSSQANFKSSPKDTTTIPASENDKKSKICNSNKRKLDEDITSNSSKCSRVSENKHASFENAENSSNTEMTCITNLLQSVSNHLIHILHAYSKYAELKEKKPANSQETEKAWANFLRCKCYFFNLSFCTVDSIILPQEKNVFFTGRFLNDTIKLAASRKLILCLETQVAPLFLELLEWTKQKKLRLNNIPIDTISNTVPSTTGRTPNHPLLNQQLRSPPKPIGGINTDLKFQCDNLNTSVNTPQQKNPSNTLDVASAFSNTLNTTFANNYHPGMPAIAIATSNEGSVALKDINRHIQHIYLPPHYGSLSNQNQNVEGSLHRFANSHVEHNATVIMTAPPAKNSSLNNNASCLPKTNQIQAISNRSNQDPNLHKATSFISPNRTENSQSVLFTTGPPDRQVSITVLQELLEHNNSITDTAPNLHESKVQPLQNAHSRSEMFSAPPSYEETTQTRLNKQMYTRHAAEQNFYNNSYLQRNDTQACQNTTVIAVDQTRQSNNQGNPIYMQQGQQTPLQTMASNYFRQSYVPQGYQMTATATPPWQQSTPAYNRSVDPKQMVPAQPLIQPEHQNQEMARSGSTDSGFMSPLNFYGSSETNKDGTEESFSVPSPMITHVTSLNPQVKYISEGSCYVCGSKTRKMCNGCYTKYYCSLQCQRSDWSIHKAACGQ